MWMDKLAELAVFGANVQEGQLVAVTSFVGKEDVARRIARVAYERGAKYVDVVTFDQWVKRERIAHAAEETLDYAPPWMSQRLLHLSDEHAARITLSGPHAPARAGGSRSRARRAGSAPVPARDGRGRQPADDQLDDRPGADARLGRRSCIRISIPTRRSGRLWEAVAHVCRLDAEDPEQAWIERTATLEVERRSSDRAPLRRPPAARARNRPHDRAPPFVRLAGGGLRHGRRVAPSSEPPDRGDVHDSGSRARERLRERDDAPRARGLGRLGHPHRVRERARGRDRRRPGRRRAPHRSRVGRRSLTARRDRARRRRGPHRAARDDVLRHADRRERGLAHRARKRATTTRSRTRGQEADQRRAASTSTS